MNLLVECIVDRAYKPATKVVLICGRVVYFFHVNGGSDLHACDFENSGCLKA